MVLGRLTQYPHLKNLGFIITFSIDVTLISQVSESIADLFVFLGLDALTLQLKTELFCPAWLAKPIEGWVIEIA